MLMFGSLHINWTWYAGVTLHTDGSVTLHVYDRLHNCEDTGHPSTVGGIDLVESSPVFVGPYAHEWDAVRSVRDVVAVRIRWTGVDGVFTYPVRNVANVFSYGRFPLN